MPLVFAAVVPHSPLFVPNIGKENASHFKATLEAAAALSEQFAAAAADIVVVVTSHGPRRPASFAINVSPRFTSNFEIFGDLVTRWEFSGEIELAAKLRERLELKVPLVLTHEEGLDYGSSIPLSLLTVAPAGPTVLPLSVSGLSLAEHATAGRLLQDVLLDESKRIAIIASADLSHKLNKKSPAGYSAKAKKLDQKIIDCLVNRNAKALLEIDPKLLEETAVEDMEALALVSGLLDDVNCDPKLLSYEGPFGVGYALINFNLVSA